MTGNGKPVTIQTTFVDSILVVTIGELSESFALPVGRNRDFGPLTAVSSIGTIEIPKDRVITSGTG